MFHNADEINFQLEWPEYSATGSHEQLGLTWSDAPSWVYLSDTGAKSAFLVTLEDSNFTVRFNHNISALYLSYQESPLEFPFVLQAESGPRWRAEHERCAFSYDMDGGWPTICFAKTLTVDGGILIVGTIDLGGDSKKPS